MRIPLVLLTSLLVPCIALADPQCSLSQTLSSPDSITRPQPGASPLFQTSQTLIQDVGPAVAQTQVLQPISDLTVLHHIIAAGSKITDAGTLHELRAVVARNEGQFIRLYVPADGQVLVAGLMAEISPDDLLAMAPGQTNELGSFHGMRGIFVRNAGQFQVFYASPDGERVIPGAMFNAQGKNLTHDQIASIPGVIPTVLIGNAAGQMGASAQTPTGSLLKAVEATTFGTLGSPSAPRLWVFVDPLCAWSVRAMSQLRSYVTAGRVQLAVIPVVVLDHENEGRSTVAAKAMLSLPQDTMVAAWNDNKLSKQAGPVADQRLSGNMAAVAAVGLRGTPTFVWRKVDGSQGRADGLPSDIEGLIASMGR